MIFVGVDVGKRSHAVCFMDAAGQQVARPLRVPHTGAGLRQVQARLHGLHGPTQVIMEASGAHWMGLARRMRAEGLAVQVVNPLQTAGLRKVGIRKTKSDAKDALVVADLARANFIASPHIAGISVEGQIDNRTKQAQEVVRVLTGHPPLNPVVPED